MWFFQQSKFVLANNKYKKITDYLEHETDLEGEQKEKRDALVLAAHLNMAICYLKMDDHFHCIEQCDKALELDAKNEKALFRRASVSLVFIYCCVCSNIIATCQI